MDMYRVVDSSNNQIVAKGFATKTEAKVKRNELNPVVETKTDARPRYIVSRGLDHPLGPSNGRNNVDLWYD